MTSPRPAHAPDASRLTERRHVRRVELIQAVRASLRWYADPKGEQQVSSRLRQPSRVRHGGYRAPDVSRLATPEIGQSR